GVVGVLVSVVSWGFLGVIHYIQEGAYKDVPDWLGFTGVPTWWPLPVMLVAGVLTAVAVLRLPGRGGHEPYRGLSGGVTRPVDLPGILLPGPASLGLGLGLAPGAPPVPPGVRLAPFAAR